MWSCTFSILRAQESITTYFHNDSINGLRISDAYETHNMGILWKKDDIFLELDLGIVSPDMHLYKNQYRVANRSFGEIISLTVGAKQSYTNNVESKYYLRVKRSGTYGIDNLQDLAHRILGLQPVNQVNDLVRMPNDTWIGIGGKVSSRLKPNNFSLQTAGLNFYLGSDKVEINPFILGKIEYDNYLFIGEIGINLVPFDKLVSAPPIVAEHRNLIPYIELGLNFEYLGVDWYLKDKFSLPTVASDNSVYGVLSAGIEFSLN